MILIIDNYDSFVVNLERYVKICGFDTLVVRNDKITISQIKQLSPSKIIISPGPSTPLEAGISIALVKEFYKSIPILGVCLGHQIIGQAFGANVTHATAPMHGMSSMITHDNSQLFRNLPNPLTVGRYHSLIVSNITDNIPLSINAVSHENEIMAIQHKTYPVYGVQFHPESILTQHGITLLNNFLNL